MKKLELKENFSENKKDLSRCLVFEVYLHPEESFVCPRCRKGPLCRKHRIPGRKECASCVFDMRNKELQFIFIVFAVFFAALKFGLGHFVETLQEPLLASYLLYLGIIAVATYIIFSLVSYNQRSKIADAELLLKKLDSRG